MSPVFPNSAAVPQLPVVSPAVDPLPPSVAPVFTRPPADTGSASLTAEPVFPPRPQSAGRRMRPVSTCLSVAG